MDGEVSPSGLNLLLVDNIRLRSISYRGYENVRRTMAMAMAVAKVVAMAMAVAVAVAMAMAVAVAAGVAVTMLWQ